YLVFAQTDDAAVPVERLIAQARAHFDGRLSAEPSPQADAEARLSYSAHGTGGGFTVTSRAAQPADVAAARKADCLAPSGGLADLAARCKTVWTIEARDQPAEWLVLEFLALLASVALGPILPPDGTRLLGVRSARERSGALRGAPPLTR